MALTKVTSGGITDSAITSAKINDGSIINADVKSDAAITASKLSATLDLSSKTVTLPAASVTAHATNPTKTSIEALAIDLPAANLTGTINSARLGSGTAGSGNFLRGDGAWEAAGATGLDDVSGVARATSGLLFNSDTVAANKLDDYEEGTWTPSLDNAQTGSATIGTLHTATYTKIGNKVHLYCSMAVTSSSTPATGGFRFTGFPFGFAAAGENGFLICIHYNYKEPTMSFLNTSGYGYYTKETVGGNNLGGINEILDSSNSVGINFTYTTT